MKSLIVSFVLCLLALGASAQQTPPNMNAILQQMQSMENMSEADQQKMMQQLMQSAQESQACLAQVDEAEIKKLEQQAKAMETKVNALCKAGKRAEAEKTAMKFGMEIANAPAVKQLQNCGKAFTQQLMASPMMQSYQNNAADQSRHLCDSIE